MIDIKTAIEQARAKKNISDGGSQCYDFGDVVLVKYTLPVKYVVGDKRARYGEEDIREGINKKTDLGVNTPRHIDMLRTIEGENDICYVLQEKCPGVNCAPMATYGVPYERMINELEAVCNIPFEHYRKMVSDGTQLFEMGYEAKNKNLFYDEESGFWYIDFLEYDREYPFDPNDSIRMFEAVKYRMPRPRQLASTMSYDAELTSEEQEKKELLENSIEAKHLLAIREVIPGFKRYEKFYLLEKSDSLKRYLMQEGIVESDLFRFEDEDYPIYDELYELVVNRVIKNIVDKGEPLWSIQMNAIRNEAGLFSLQRMWEGHKDNGIRREDYTEEYDYHYDVADDFTGRMLDVIIKRLETIEPNDNVRKFLEDYAAMKSGNKTI